MDFLIVGLGNPGPKYEKSHHNAGFLALDHLAQQLGCPVTRAKFQALTGQAELCGHKVLLMKPQTFMNLSGNAVGAAARFYHLTPDRVLVIYDDIALAPGRLRIRPSGSAGGHNGIKSIIAALGSEAFPGCGSASASGGAARRIWPILSSRISVQPIAKRSSRGSTTSAPPQGLLWRGRSARR